MGREADDVVMSARGITKVYGGTRALHGVDFDIRRGAVTVLYGENGAGKSTLMRIMSGVERPTAGSLFLDGDEVEFHTTTDAERRGVAIIHQELNLSANLTVAESIFLGREITRFGMVDNRAQIERAKASGVESVVFDRAGNKYHGRVAALADGAREGGLTF